MEEQSGSELGAAAADHPALVKGRDLVLALLAARLHYLIQELMRA